MYISINCYSNFLFYFLVFEHNSLSLYPQQIEMVI